MLEADPEKRPSAKEALGHAFFREDYEVLKDMLHLNRQVTQNIIVNNELLIDLQNSRGLPNREQSVGKQTLINKNLNNRKERYVVEDPLSKNEVENNPVCAANISR